MDQSFQLAELPGPVAVVTFDVPGKKVNTLSRSVRIELDSLLSELERRTDFLGLLFRSGKAGQFVAGADLRELSALASEPPEHVTEFLEQGHQLLNRLAALPYPTVALVDGVALGGGTELALAFDYRVASPAARFGLPETKLGMIPGWGGTQRLPRVIGIPRALEIIYGGEPIPVDQAKSLGLADATCESQSLIQFGNEWITDVRKQGTWRTLRDSRQAPVTTDAQTLEQVSAPFRAEIGNKSDARSVGQLAAIQSVCEGVLLSLDEGLKIELRVAATVIGSVGAAGLIDEFFRNRGAPKS